MRIVVLVLAVVMMTASPAELCASPDATSLVDDASDLDPLILPVKVTVLPAVVRPPVRFRVPGSALSGRMHAVLVFRPPRLAASR